MNRILVVFVGLLAGTLVVTATAQETGLPAPAAVADKQSPPEWKLLARAYQNERLILVTASEPGVRHRCKLESLSGKEIVCKGRLGLKTTYGDDDVMALIRPGKHTHVLLWFLGIIAIGGGVAIGGYFAASVAIAAAVPLALLALAIVISAGLVGLVMAMKGEESDRPESIIYQRPGTELTIKLR